MYRLIPSTNYRSLVLLSQIVELVVSPVFDEDMLECLYRLLHEHHKVFCQVYGKWSVTVNYHMSLHLPRMIADLGPPHAFWCFPYERINGMLIGTPNSGGNVEAEVASRFIRDMSLSNRNTSVDPTNVPKDLRELLYECDDATLPYPYTYWVMSLLSGPPRERFQTQLDIDRGSVDHWPIQLESPHKLNARMTESFLKEAASFFESLYGTTVDYIRPRISKYGRCKVNGITFSSTFNSTDRGGIVKTMFVDISNELIPYFGLVHFYFVVTVVQDQQLEKHKLAYVTCLKFKDSGPDSSSKLYGLSMDTFNISKKE